MFTGRRYQPVSQQGDSESDSDETTLFTAENGSSQKGEWQFGVRAYDLSQDLDLPRVRTVHPSSKLNKIKGYSRKQALFGACLFIVIVATVTALGVLFLMKQSYAVIGPATTSEPTTTSEPPTTSEQATTASPSPVEEEPTIEKCDRPPKPLENFGGSNGRRPPCGGGKTPPKPIASSTTQSIAEIKTEPPPIEVTEHSPSEGTTVPPSEEMKTSPSVEEATTKIRVESPITSSVEVPISSPTTSQPLPEAATTTSEATTPPSDVGHKSTTLQPEGESPTEPITTPTNIDHSLSSITTTSTEYDDLLHDWSNKISSEISPSADSTTQHSPSSETTTSAELSHVTTQSAELHDVLTSEANKGNGKVSPTSEPRSVNWERDFFPAMSESTTELFDINRDGVMDVVIVEDYSECGSRIIAMDGEKGDKFWQKEVNFPAFAVRCELDVNGDDAMDCLVTGRGGGFAAIDPRDGSILWEVEPSIVFPRYNFYFPLIVKDLNNDGVDDLINMHGGDVTYKPQQHDRSPGLLVVISGKTGQSLMPPMLTPDGHETYMSPVLFKLNGKDDFVLFGTGGETVPGSLWGVSLLSIRTQVFKHQYSHKGKVEPYKPFINDTYHPCLMQGTDMNKLRPTFDQTAYDFQRPIFVTSSNNNMRFCPRWENVRPIWNKYGVCLYELVKAEFKGVMIPPVIVDLDLDGIDDLVVSTYDGHTIALNGSDAVTRLWDVYYPSTESYSVPTPLFYNEDSIPDLLIRTNLGEWDHYNSSSIRLLDGRNGAEIWSFDSAHTGMMSTISIASESPGSDAMLFMTIGTTDSNTDPSYAGGERRVRRHGDDVLSADISIPGDVAGEAEELEDDHHGNKGPGEVDYEEDFMDRVMKNRDPPDLWISTPSDQFPDPKLDVDGFMRYCGESYGRLSAYLWLVTRRMIETGAEIGPIAIHEPVILTLPEAPPSNGSSSNNFPPGVGPPPGGSPPDVGPPPDGSPLSPNDPPPDDQPPSSVDADHFSKRHGDAGDAAVPEFGGSSKKAARCGHISAPLQVIASPAVGDFDSDGRLDVAYSVVWASAFQSELETAPELKVFAFNLEDRYSQLMGEEVKGQKLVDFDSFLLADHQPWNRYMGRHGNNVYHRN